MLTCSPTPIPEPAIASYFMLLIDTSRWILRIPSRAGTPGISSWNRIFLHARNTFGAREILVGGVAAPPGVCGRCTPGTWSPAQCAPLLARVRHQTHATALVPRMHSLNGVRQIWPARTDVGAEHVRTVALVARGR